MSYSVQANVGGKLAQLGARLVGGAARKMAGDVWVESEEGEGVVASLLQVIREDGWIGQGVAVDLARRFANSGGWLG